MTRLLSITSIACLLTGACDGREPELQQSRQPIIASNIIASNIIASNAITSNAIASNAIASNALAGAFLPPDDDAEILGVVTQPDVVTGLQDPDAEMLMKYVVACALSPEQELQWTGRFSPFPSARWRGALGLCPQWLASGPSPECLQRVSGCLLARNNAFGISVPISLRGDLDGTNAIPLAPTVDAWTKKWRTATDVQSALPCATTTLGLTRNCGWQSAGVGRCTPGQPVSVGAGGCGLGDSTGNTLLRVCTRMHFCDEGSPELIAENDGACGSSQPMVSALSPSTLPTMRSRARTSSKASPPWVTTRTPNRVSPAASATRAVTPSPGRGARPSPRSRCRAARRRPPPP